jgi:hypothetical protein
MSLEESFRRKISELPYGSTDRNLLKLVLGEIQQIKKTVTVEDVNTIIKKIIKGNEELMGMVDPEGHLRLPEGDARRAQFVSENEFLSDLLPKYWNAIQVRESLDEHGVDVKSEEKEGEAIKKAISHLNGLGAPIDGKIVKEVVVEMRK